MKVIDSAGLILGQHHQPYGLSVTFTPPHVNEGFLPSQEAESLWKEAECAYHSVGTQFTSRVSKN